MRMKHEFELKELRCLDCPMFNFWMAFCQAAEKSLDDYMSMPEWCPLVDVTFLPHVENRLPEQT